MRSLGRWWALAAGAVVVAMAAAVACGGAAGREGGPTPVDDRELPPVAALAVADLATRLGIDPDAVAVVEVRPVQWSDACLGVHLPGQLCAQVITPGYLVRLKAQDREYIYHTDLQKRVIATDFAPGASITEPFDLSLAPAPEPPPARLVTSAGEQTGGIGSYCWAEGGAGVCVDKIGLPTPKVPVVVRAGERIVFQLGFEPTEASLSAWRIAAGGPLRGESAEALWQFEGQAELALELLPRSSLDFTVDLPPGRYVFMVSAVGPSGDVAYGFLVEVADASSR